MLEGFVWAKEIFVSVLSSFLSFFQCFSLPFCLVSECRLCRFVPTSLEKKKSQTLAVEQINGHLGECMCDVRGGRRYGSLVSQGAHITHGLIEWRH